MRFSRTSFLPHLILYFGIALLLSFFQCPQSTKNADSSEISKLQEEVQTMTLAFKVVPERGNGFNLAPESRETIGKVEKLYQHSKEKVQESICFGWHPVLDSALVELLFRFKDNKTSYAFFYDAEEITRFESQELMKKILNSEMPITVGSCF